MARVRRFSRFGSRGLLLGGHTGPRILESRGVDLDPTQVKKLSHYDDRGTARMVDVSDKSPTRRTARAHAFVKLTLRR